MSGTIILVIGTSSAGKSSMIRELQELLPEHYLALGIDTFFQMASPRWGGGMGGPLSKDGFRYVTTVDENQPYTRIVYGAVGTGCSGVCIGRLPRLHPVTTISSLMKCCLTKAYLMIG